MSKATDVLGKALDAALSVVSGKRPDPELRLVLTVFEALGRIDSSEADAALAALDGPWALAREWILGPSPRERAHRAHAAQITAGHEALRENRLAEFAVHDLDALEAQFRVRLEIASSLTREIESEAARIAAPILEAFVAKATSWIEAREKEEQSEAHEHGLTYHESLLVGVAKQLVLKLRGRILAKQFYGLPSSALGFLKG